MPNYLYHVTLLRNLDNIATNGLFPGRSENFPGYAGHARGKVFLTTEPAVSGWIHKVTYSAAMDSDYPVEEGFIPIVLRVPLQQVEASLHLDELGSRDVPEGDSFYVEDTIRPEELEVYTPTGWVYVDDVNVQEMVDYALENSPRDEDDGEEWIELDEYIFAPDQSRRRLGWGETVNVTLVHTCGRNSIEPECEGAEGFSVLPTGKMPKVKKGCRFIHNSVVYTQRTPKAGGSHDNEPKAKKESSSRRARGSGPLQRSDRGRDRRDRRRASSSRSCQASERRDDPNRASVSGTRSVEKEEHLHENPQETIQARRTPNRRISGPLLESRIGTTSPRRRPNDFGRVRAESRSRTIQIARVVGKDLRKHVPSTKHPSIRNSFVVLSKNPTYGDTKTMGKILGLTLYRHRIGQSRIWYVLRKNNILFLGVDLRDEKTYDGYLNKYERRYKKHLKETSVPVVSSSPSFKRPTEAMLKFFKRRTTEHIERVGKYLKMLKGFKDLSTKDLAQRARDHDKDKYSDKDLILPYIWVTEYHRVNNDKGSVPDWLQEQYDLADSASGTHVERNLHHPEAHTSPEEMSELDLAEMVCDWAAMAEELGEGSPRGWADKNVGSKWKFSDEQTKFLYDVIGWLEEKGKLV
jgi:hypothetical protein